MTHVVTLRDIYDQGQATHDSVIRLEGKVENLKHAQEDTDKDVTDLKTDVEGVKQQVRSLQLDRAKAIGYCAAVGIVSSGGTAGVIQFINNK